MSKLEDQAELIYDFFADNEFAVLLVLDACNWKALQALRSDLSFRVVRSRGSWTLEWLQETFREPLMDVVYVSANPYTYLLKDLRGKFKRIIDLPLFCWNEQFNTVHPKSVNTFVLESIRNDEKKIIAHYMQPHAPFIFETWLNDLTHDFRDGKRELEVYKLARKNSKIRREFMKAYMKNLEIVLNHAEKLIKTIQKINPEIKTVITSDHSEILRGIYYPVFRKKFWKGIPWILGIYKYVGHGDIKIPELREVPWITF